MKERNIIYLLAILALFGLLLSGCNKDEDKEEPSSMTATIDGNLFSATNFVFNIFSDTLTSVIGWANDEYLGFNLMNATSTGNYDVSITFPHTAQYSDDGQSSFYLSRQGRVEVTENSTLRIKGTFEFLAFKSATQDTILVDNGQFDVSKNE